VTPAHQYPTGVTIAALRISWLVVPDALRRDLRRLTPVRAGVSAIDQLALADFVARGDLDRQVRRTRSRHRRRRDQLTAMLTSETPWLDVQGTSAGLHLMATLRVIEPRR
jgi:GntR family transcriptional regulator/MocR family aminotransferase